MKIKISGFSEGSHGRLGDTLFLLSGSGDDVELHEGDEVEIIVITAQQSAQADECSICHETQGLQSYLLCERHAKGL